MKLCIYHRRLAGTRRELTVAFKLRLSPYRQRKMRTVMGSYLVGTNVFVHRRRYIK